MAENFVNAKLDLLTGQANIYITPAGVKALVLGCIVANVDGTNDADVTIQWSDSSDSGTVTQICKNVTVPAKASFAPIPDKLVLEPGDKLQGLASNNGDLSVSVSVLEISA